MSCWLHITLVCNYSDVVLLDAIVLNLNADGFDLIELNKAEVLCAAECPYKRAYAQTIRRTGNSTVLCNF